MTRDFDDAIDDAPVRPEDVRDRTFMQGFWAGAFLTLGICAGAYIATVPAGV